MDKAGKTRTFGGEKYSLESNAFGTTITKADKMRTELKNKGYNVRVVWSGAKPWVYPEGRYFVYAKK